MCNSHLTTRSTYCPVKVRAIHTKVRETSAALSPSPGGNQLGSWLWSRLDPLALFHSRICTLVGKFHFFFRSHSEISFGMRKRRKVASWERIVEINRARKELAHRAFMTDMIDVWSQHLRLTHTHIELKICAAALLSASIMADINQVLLRHFDNFNLLEIE